MTRSRQLRSALQPDAGSGNASQSTASGAPTGTGNYQSTGQRLLSLPDAARYLGGISVAMVRTLVWRGEVGAVSIGRRLLVDVRDLDAWIEKAKGQARPSQPYAGWRRRERAGA